MLVWLVVRWKVGGGWFVFTTLESSRVFVVVIIVAYFPCGCAVLSYETSTSLTLYIRPLSSVYKQAVFKGQARYGMTVLQMECVYVYVCVCM